ncbi:MAG: glycosyltransferase [Bacteroidetes bacterium]|nr:glycosyltransferase [Bacteroidota bacterium]MCL5738515.1 glycosyltransferase [Bacteroidota bacterium]
MKTKLSLCMIVKNEEEYLPKCLQSVRGIADEIIVVDTGSTDSTIEIAKRFGAKVVDHKWRSDFAEARNVSLEFASGEWILVLDADEELPQETRNKIAEVIGTLGADGIEVLVRSELPDGDAAIYDETKIVRLFRSKKEYRYVMPIHEQIRPSIEKGGGKIFASDLVISHHGYSRGNVQGKENRADRNLKMLYNALSISPDDPYLHYQIGATLMSIGKRDEAYDELKKTLALDYAKLSGATLDKLFMKISQLALERNDYGQAIEFAEKSLQQNPRNVISQYVAAIAYLSRNQIMDGYRLLLRIRENQNSNLKLGKQLKDLINACEKALNV